MSTLLKEKTSCRYRLHKQKENWNCLPATPGSPCGPAGPEISETEEYKSNFFVNTFKHINPY